MRSFKNAGMRQIKPYLLMVMVSAWQLSLPANADVGSVGGTNTSLFRDAPANSVPDLEPNTRLNTHALPVHELHGSVAVIDAQEKTPEPGQLIDHLVETAVARDKEKEQTDRKARLHNKKLSRILGRSRDMLEFATSYQGFESSSEAADVILGEKLRLKSRAAVEFARQKKVDSAHVQLTCALMEVATGLGLSDEAKRSQAIESGRQEMIPLIGEEGADQTIKSLTAWSKNLTVANAAFERDPWDVLTIRNKSRTMLANSLQGDDVVKSIEARLHRFNHLSNFSRAAAKFINTTMSIIALSPTFASPAAQTAEFIFVACTGGPEEKKLLKEVYLDRCFESRFDRLNQEIGMSINNYNSAILTHNPVLLSCSQSVMEKLTTPQAVASLTGDSAAGSTADSAQLGEQPQVFGERL